MRSPAWRPAVAAGLPRITASTVRENVTGRGPVHPGDLHVAAERERGDAVLDPASHPLDERWTEAEVELARGHADGARDEEVPGLVHEDEDRQPEDRDGRAHAGSGTSSRARPSASTSSSRSRAGEPSTRARTAATAGAMSRKATR